jgi:hypothetical protein
MTRRLTAVIGASLVGLWAAEQPRAQGYDDDFVIIGAEPSSWSGGARRYTSALATPSSMSTRDPLESRR